MFNYLYENIQSSMFLRSMPRYVTVFGSAKKVFQNDHPFGVMAYEVGAALAKENFTVMTGGGPGIMSKVNEGAFKVNKNLSISCKLKVVSEPPNKFVYKSVATQCLSIRKRVLLKNALAYVVLPGGYGTLDELFEVVTLMKVGIIKERRPVILIDSNFWSPLINFINTRLKENQIIVDHEINLIQIVDKPSEIVDVLQKRTVCEGVYI